MNSFLKVFVICSALIIATQAVCFSGQQENNGTLNFCSEYSGNTCCDQQTDAIIQSNFTLGIAPVLGFNGSCAANARRLTCLTCAPNNTNFGVFTPGANYSTLNYFINSTFSYGLYQSCYNICLIGAKIGTTFPSSAAFLGGFFSTANNPNYVPSPVNPVTTFAEGINPNTNGSFTANITAAVNSDNVGCPAIPPACPLSNWQSPKAVNLSFCSQYAASSCCDVAQDNQVAANFLQKVGPVFGTGGCSQNIKNLICGFTCSPNQAQFVNFTFGANYSTLNVFVSQKYADGTYTACGDVCLPFGDGVLVENNFANGAALIGFLGSANDPSYIPSPIKPVLTYTVGTNPLTNAYFNNTVTPATAADQVGCAVVTSGEVDGALDGSSASLTQVNYFVAAFVAVVVAAMN